MNDRVRPALPCVSATLWIVDGKGFGDFVVRELSLREELGVPYRMTLSVLASDVALHPRKLVGQSVCVSFGREAPAETSRIIYGLVTSVTDEGLDDDVRRVDLVIEPALAMLRYRRDTRIFTHMTVPQILEAVLQRIEAWKRPPADFRLANHYEPRDLCVQYDETDLDFCHRLMSEEGIVYRFEEENDAEHLVLCDSLSTYASVVAEPLKIAAAQPDEEHLATLHQEFSHLPTSFVASGFNWRIPDATDFGTRGNSKWSEVYEHDIHHQVVDAADNGPHVPKGDTQSDRRAALRQVRRRVETTEWYGSGNVSTLVAGSLFEVESADENHDGQRLCAFRVVHRASFPVQRIATGYAPFPDQPSYSCQLWATAIPYVRALVPGPRIFGPQTATVVGPPGEEIHVDPYGRIMVRFHWERLAPPLETDGWWVRVRQDWSGPGWGSMFVPRVGMEVVVEFLDGNPDDPLVTGCVYNGKNLPPHPLPDQKTRSGIRSSSSPGGDGFNELRFEDAAGSEEVFLHAQKTLTECVKGSRSLSVGGGRSASVGGDDSNAVTGSQTLTVKKDRTKTVTGTEARTVTGARTTRLEADDTTTVVGHCTEMIDGGLEQVIGGDAKYTVCDKHELLVTGKHVVTVTGPSTFAATESYDATAMTRLALAQAKVGKMVMEAGGVACWGSASVLLSSGPEGGPTATVSLSADGKVTIEAKTELVLKCGGTTLTLAADGTLSLLGPQKVAIAGGGSSTLDLSATGAELAGPSIKSAAQGDNEITGAKVKLN